MKRIFEHPEKRVGGRQYWRSLEEYAETPEFQQWIEREFPAGAAELEADGVTRRGFLRLMGASMALAGIGLTGCRRPESYIAPFTNSVEWGIPGKPLFYATAMPSRKGALPLVATTHDGRPTKLDGNPLFTRTSGKSDVFTQGEILNFWDPDRSAGYVNNGQPVTRQDFVQFATSLRAQLGDGSKLAVLMDGRGGPTRLRLMRELRKVMPGVQFAAYEPLGSDGESQAVEAAFGKGAKLHRKLDQADVILSLGADFLGPVEGHVEDVQGFAAKRRVEKTSDSMNRLYVVENHFTVTGGMADHRLRIKASAIPAFAAALAQEVAKLTGDNDLLTLAQSAAAATGPAEDTHKEWLLESAKDLVQHRSKALVVAGSLQPALVHALALGINHALQAIGSTVSVLPAEEEAVSSLQDLASSISNNQVEVLIIAGGNPVFDAPADLNWAQLQQSVPTVIRLGLYEDETSQFAHWHVPAAHFLEDWDDAEAPDGTYLAIQPLILPLYEGLSLNGLLGLLSTGEIITDSPSAVRATFDEKFPGSSEDDWRKFLREGFLTNSAPLPLSATPNVGALLSLVASAKDCKPTDALELVLVGDSKIDDGAYVNNGWLQELPESVTKLTWTNAALVSPATAKKLGISSTDMLSDKGLRSKDGGSDIIELEANGRKIKAPILIAPGHADDSITLSLGYGRERCGRVAEGSGVNAYALRTTSSSHFMPVKVTATGERRHIPVTHGHWTMESRDPVREATLDAFRKDPTFAQTMGMDGHIPPDISIYNSPPLDAPEQWAMTIDLNTCTGCNACVVACQAENNIPIVGPEQVINQREMHWIRIDRYFSTVSDDDPNPEMVMQPLNCQHCENAPCETVCPVNATVHSEEGLNVMVYNRCIGTRYCANNCPYKVRRFNFFDYNKRDVLSKSRIFPDGRGNVYDGPFARKGSPESLQMQRNPNVTVRMRGVMEKCTFCIQRIEEAKIKVRVEAGASDKLKIPTDTVKSACQQACPADAITFGDQADPESQVAKLRTSDRGYSLLKYLNVRPRVTYLARLRNPNPAMPGADKIGMINHSGGHGDGHGATHASDHHDAAAEPHNAHAESAQDSHH